MANCWPGNNFLSSGPVTHFFLCKYWNWKLISILSSDGYILFLPRPSTVQHLSSYRNLRQINVEYSLNLHCTGLTFRLIHPPVLLLCSWCLENQQVNVYIAPRSFSFSSSCAAVILSQPLVSIHRNVVVAVSSTCDNFNSQTSSLSVN